MKEETEGHRCAVTACETVVDVNWLMCSQHWLMVPRSVRRRVHRNHRSGQRLTGQVSGQWIESAKEALAWVIHHEGRKN